MPSLKEILERLTSFLKERRAAEEILVIALKMKRLDLYLHFDKPIGFEEVEQCRRVLKRYLKGEPFAHIQGYVDFFDCKISVTKDVLIPRLETELLVAQIAKEPLIDQSVLDLCTGSGCIAIALKKRFPHLHVVASDISAKALAVARENAKVNEVEIEWIEGDFLSCINKKFHYIVCNPPYIGYEEKVDASVKNFEPNLALFAPDEGLYFYKILAQNAYQFLHPEGKLFLEIGYAKGPAIEALFEAYRDVKLTKDYAGLDRFLSCKICL